MSFLDVVSGFCKVAAGIVTVIFWPVGLAFAAGSAIIDISETERKMSKR